MSYNLTAIMANSTGMVGFVQGVNDVLMFGMLGIFLLIGITLLTFIAFIQATNDTNRALAASSFIAFGLAIMLKALALIPSLALYIALILSAGTLAFTFKK